MDEHVETGWQSRLQQLNLRQRFVQLVRKPVSWVVSACRAAWRFLGRLGLAFRNLLTWFIWKPLLFLTMPLWLPLSWLWELIRSRLPAIWRFVGRVGLAERRLFIVGVWRPFLVVVIRPLRWLLQTLYTLFTQMWQWLRRHAQRQWDQMAPQRAILRRRYGSPWQVRWARLRVKVLRPAPPMGALVAPSVPVPITASKRMLRLALGVAVTAVIATTIILNNRPQTDVAAFMPATPEKIVVVLTPTPLPATPTPPPQIEVKLTPWSTPDPLAHGGSLAFTLHTGGNSDIYILPVGQAEPFRLTSHPAADMQPTWSPDGQSLAFASHRDGNWDIYIYNLPGQTLRRVTDFPGYDGSPSWSPDGQWLVYESYQNENLDVFLVRADGSEGPFRLTENESLDFDPVWAPGGRHIVFVSWRSGNKDIFVLSLNEVTDEAAFNLTQTPDGYEDGPVFSPDGRFLAYHDTGAAVPFVYVQPLSADYLPSGPRLNVGQQGVSPVWAPDGRSLMVVHDDGAQSYLLGASPEGWGVAPQVFAAEGQISHPTWTGLQITPDMAAALRDIDQTAATAALYKDALYAPQAEGPPVLLQQMAVNAPSPYLNDRVGESFAALRERLIAEAGWDVLGQLDQMFARLNERPLPGQPRQWWHQAGRAFDLPYRDVLAFAPRFEVVREDIGAETYWRVFVRTEAQDGSMGQPLRELPWDFRARFEGDPQYFDEGGKPKDAIPGGYYLDFTALAADYGWQRVPATGNWRTYFQGVRFWQYENRQGLTWPEAMLELYTPDELDDLISP